MIIIITKGLSKHDNISGNVELADEAVLSVAWLKRLLCSSIACTCVRQT